MTTNTIRLEQQLIIGEINQVFKTNNKCSVKMQCGAGKTNVILNILTDYPGDLFVIVYPINMLVTQLGNYLSGAEWFDKFGHMLVNNGCVEDGETIRRFISGSGKKIISCTYQSFDTLMSVLSGMDAKIGLVVCDGAHDIIGSKAYGIILNDNMTDIRTIFLSNASPYEVKAIDGL